MSASGSEVVVRVRNMAFGGDGVGEVCEPSEESLLGITAFVPFSVPGELLRGRVTEHKPRYVKADLIEVLHTSESRVTPPCSVFGTCGGCELQHIDYSKQLELKHEMIRGQLAASRLGVDVLDALEPVIASNPYHYRRRVSLHIDEQGAVGFYRANSRSVVSIDECPISVPEINDYLRNVQEFGSLVRGRISSLQLDADPLGVVAVMKTGYDLGKVEQKALLDVARRFFDNGVLMSSQGELGGFGRQILELPLQESDAFTLKVPAGYFSQVNWDVNRRLISEVLLEAKPEGKSICDLYAGAGNFSLPLARNGGRVVAVECDKRLAALARQNIARYQLQRSLQFVEASVEKFLNAQKPQRGAKGQISSAANLGVPSRFDLVIADPPRSGLQSVTFGMLPEAEKFLLISCHLPSLVRDLRTAVDSGWRVKRIVPFDMFAQTSYVEILAVLDRE